MRSACRSVVISFWSVRTSCRSAWTAFASFWTSFWSWWTSCLSAWISLASLLMSVRSFRRSRRSWRTSLWARFPGAAPSAPSATGPPTVPRPVAVAVLIVAGLPAALAGQEPAPAAPTPAPVRVGVAVGVVSLSDTRSEQALTTTLEYDPTSWLSLSVFPSGVRIAQTPAAGGRTVSRSGLTDLPVSAAASYTFPTGWSPNLGAGVIVTLPTGACGLGTGVASVGINGGIGIAPLDPLRLSVDASRSLTGNVSQSALVPAAATWVSGNASVTLSDRWTATVSYGTALRVPDSLVSRQLGGGLRSTPAPPLTLTFDASHGLTRGSPRWVFSMGFGTAFAGISAVTPTAPLLRLQTTFVGGRPGTTTTPP